MQFFKHFTDAHRGKSLRIIYKRFGFAGTGRYWHLVELCAEKMTKTREEEFGIEHTNFEFEKSFLMASLGYANLKQAACYLHALAELGLCSVVDQGEVWLCSMPKLLEILDRDTSRARPRRATDAPKIKIEDKDIDTRAVGEEKKERFVPNLEEIYSKYPRKIGKARGLKKLNSEIKNKEIEDQVFQALDKFIQHHQNAGTGQSFIPYFSTWANNWRDYLDPDFGQSNLLTNNSTGMNLNL